ncbi:Protein cwh43 [Basidiobolus ranarum]|uniref:Protein cwh43 n=1 Tax=Basidiobolus ranarum TaxID=34480 RepID=A0ABR2WR42_9FUNG
MATSRRSKREPLLHAEEAVFMPQAILGGFNGKYIAYLHTILAFSAFLVALVVGCQTHYYKIVENEYFRYPDEWFPSVSATIGDRYPARAIFQIFIAATATPRFLLLFLWYFVTASRSGSSTTFKKVLLVIGVIRTFACAVFVYVTSSDDHMIHDVGMVIYILFTFPYMFGTMYTSSSSLLQSSPTLVTKANRLRKIMCGLFIFTLGPLVHYYIKHKVDKIPGAYTIYAFFEWSLIMYDISFDAASVYDFQTLHIQVLDVNTMEKQDRDHDFTSAGKSPFSVMSSQREWLSNFIFFSADVYLGFIFWSMLTALPLLIWYFPLWHMGISGYEAFLFITLLPVVLGVPFVRNIVRSYRGIFHLISLIGVASYLWETPTHRLIYAAIGCGISLTTWAATWYGEYEKTGRLERDIASLSLGLVLHNVVKAMWRSNNPIWPIMRFENGGANATGIFIGVLACITLIYRDFSRKQRTHDHSVSSNVDVRWSGIAVGFGAIFFILHSMLSDSSIISRWIARGYSHHEPAPVPWGALVIAALALGYTLSHKVFVTGLTWWTFGTISVFALYYVPQTPGFIAGLGFAVYTMSILPSFIRTVSICPPGRTLFLSMLTYNILDLLHVWVVAYAFVPGGPLLRESTHVILLIMMGLIGIGLRSMPTVDEKYVKSQDSSSFRSRRKLINWKLSGLVLAGALTYISRIPLEKPQPYHPEDKIMTAGIWTIHFALDNDMWASETRMRDTIRELELDVVGLLESDTQRIIMGNRDLTQSLAEDLNMYADFGPGPTSHTWGCTMLSKFPIVNSTHHLLPSPVGELACAIHATLDVYGKHVDVIVSHNGQEEDPLDRKLQTTEIARIMRESPNPFVFLGYVVTKPHVGNYHILMEDGNVNDIDPTDDDRWCEYVAFRGVKRIGYARISHGGITDTEIQSGKFQIVQENELPKDIYRRVNESDIPESQRYPPQFYGDGVRNHKYHVFNEPRYFN